MEKPSTSNSINQNHVSVDILDVDRSQPRILHKVPPQLRANKIDIYDPVVLSLGPYHHSKSSNSKFLSVEKYKKEVLNITLEPSDREFFRCKIRERVDEIRIFYEGVSIHEYNDEELVEMMLRDTCFVLHYMKMMTEDTEGGPRGKEFLRRLGLSVAIFLFRDIFMLENQLPLWVLNLLIGLKFEVIDEGKALLYKFLSSLHFMDHRLERVPWEGTDQEPLHLLEALCIIAVKGEGTGTTEMQHRRTFEFSSRWRRSSQTKIFEKANSPFRSVTDLKAKGIHFKPSSNCLMDISFNSYWFYGKLHLPIRYINNNSQVFFSNAIALEMSPESDIDFAVISYVNFMKSLIETPKDVKELREMGILFSSLRNDEEVVKMFKEINTYGIDNTDIFQEVKMRINEHCKDKGKTWMAELFHTKFRTPWTVITLLAAIFLLCLTFLQTYFTIKRRKG